MHLADIIGKVRNEAIWVSYAVLDGSDDRQVLGGCVIREHESVGGSDNEPAKMAELFLLAVDSQKEKKGIGRLILETLKQKYASIVAFADLRATGFFSKMGFLEVEEPRVRRHLLSKIESCTSSTLMLFEGGDAAVPSARVLQELDRLERTTRSFLAKRKITKQDAKFVESFVESVLQRIYSDRGAIGANHADDCAFFENVHGLVSSQFHSKQELLDYFNDVFSPGI